MLARRFLSFLIVCSGIASSAPLTAQDVEQSDQDDSKQGAPKTDGSAAARPVVIVHGAWGGAHHWKAVADGIAAQHAGAVRRASLTGLGERVHLASPNVDLQTHVQDVVNLIEFDNLQDVVLIGHSYGGVVTSGVVDAVPERIAKVIYLDAHLLDNGEAYLTHHPKDRERMTRRADEAGDGYLIPVDWKNGVRDVPHPLATLTQPLSLTNPARKGVPSAYWLFADGRPAEDDQRYRYYRRAAEKGWPVKALSWDHNPHRSRPADVTAALLEEL